MRNREAYLDKLTRIQHAIVSGIDEELIHKAIRMQCQLAASGNTRALMFVLGLCGASFVPPKPIEALEPREKP